ncbi:hypothetical protein CH381_06840 [Leptospira sp. mixed culture ATI2-C-A1]|nr:hypothetical protein CH381_06840 [Leptospira sp. mixed culture ATI2-C-A1]
MICILTKNQSLPARGIWRTWFHFATWWKSETGANADSGKARAHRVSPNKNKQKQFLFCMISFDLHSEKEGIESKS